VYYREESKGETCMAARDLEAVLLWKLCPSCTLGTVRETNDKVFRCNDSHCGAVFDFSAISDTMIAMLLQKEQNTPPGQQQNN
jgi:ribosomal protein L37AE/L43A